MSLTAAQAQAVDLDDNGLIIAIPGSGKTYTLVQRAKRLLRDPANRLGIVTFTNDSTKEIRARLTQEVGAAAMRRAQVETFHKHAILQLRSAGALGKIISPPEQNQMLRRARLSKAPDLSPEDCMAALEAYKSQLGELDPNPHPVVTAYQQMLVRAQAKDLLDVVRDTVLGMQTGSIPPLNISHLLVDEFQDTDRLQFEWLRTHVAHGVVTTVVGDDDQSVYAWRNALGYKGMLEFQECAGATLITLDVNYRCKAEILAAADRLIQHNSNRARKTLVAARGHGGLATLFRPADNDDEAWQIVKMMGPDVNSAPPGHWYSSDVPKGSWAIISRTNAHLWAAECALRASGIRYCKPTKNIEPPHVGLFLAMLDSVQEASPVGFELALQTVGVSETVVQTIHDTIGGRLGFALDHGMPDIPGLGKVDVKPAATLMERFRIWRGLTREGEYALAISGVEQWVCQNFDFKVPDRDVHDVHTVANMLSRAKGSLAQRVRTFRSPSQQKDAERGGVELHTMHSAKGLEFKNVVIIQAADGVCPSANSPDLEEERRLMYVAITRARDNLYVSCPAAKTLSPFVVEAQIPLARMVAATSDSVHGS